MAKKIGKKNVKKVSSNENEIAGFIVGSILYIFLAFCIVSYIHGIDTRAPGNLNFYSFLVFVTPFILYVTGLNVKNASLGELLKLISLSIAIMWIGYGLLTVMFFAIVRGGF